MKETEASRRGERYTVANGGFVLQPGGGHRHDDGEGGTSPQHAVYIMCGKRGTRISIRHLQPGLHSSIQRVRPP